MYARRVTQLGGQSRGQGFCSSSSTLIPDAQPVPTKTSSQPRDDLEDTRYGLLSSEAFVRIHPQGGGTINHFEQNMDSQMALR